jgi:hypothetical protein
MSMTITPKKLKEKLDSYLEISQNELIIIERSRDRRTVLISYNNYKKFIALEDEVWAKRAKVAEAEGYADFQDVQRLLKKAGLKIPE